MAAATPALAGAGAGAAAASGILGQGMLAGSTLPGMEMLAGGAPELMTGGLVDGGLSGMTGGLPMGGGSPEAGNSPEMDNAQHLANQQQLGGYMQMAGQAGRNMSSAGSLNDGPIQGFGHPWQGQMQLGINPGLQELLGSIQASSMGAWGF